VGCLLSGWFQFLRYEGIYQAQLLIYGSKRTLFDVDHENSYPGQYYLTIDEYFIDLLEVTYL
jgi:hypothetical protein